MIKCGRFSLDIQTPKIMGIVNVTPDSFSDGALYSHSLSAILHHAQSLLDDGADLLDIGGESTRPGAIPVDVTEEWRRVEQVLKEVSSWNIPISLDTRHCITMQRAIDKGYVDMVNDVNALQDAGSLDLMRQSPTIAIVLMHMQNEPMSMQKQPHYHNVREEVASFLQQRMQLCQQNGIAVDRLVFDPGIGFGKTLSHNLTLLRELALLKEDLGGYPLLLGVSRKRLFAEITGEKNPLQRGAATLVAELACVHQGASIIRTHDVRALSQGLSTYFALYHGTTNH